MSVPRCMVHSHTCSKLPPSLSYSRSPFAGMFKQVAQTLCLHPAFVLPHPNSAMLLTQTTRHFSASVCASHLTTCLPYTQDQIRLLEREKSKMEERRREGVQLFRQWKDHILADADHSKTIPAFIGHCLLPRCVMTPEDAMYCAAFIRRLTLEDTPYFSFMLCAQLVCASLKANAVVDCLCIAVPTYSLLQLHALCPVVSVHFSVTV